MEVLVSQREAVDAVRLTRKLKSLGLRLRDAYLASLKPQGSDDRGAIDYYLEEFRYTVAEDRRPEAVRPIGFRAMPVNAGRGSVRPGLNSVCATIL